MMVAYILIMTLSSPPLTLMEAASASAQMPRRYCGLLQLSTAEPRLRLQRPGPSQQTVGYIFITVKCKMAESVSPTNDTHYLWCLYGL